eukprot:gb/GEZN01003120.1/.p1 GENE.gb/GEZN01003120.1/~~gb/GEZN01003120.1/.p1  ORF type:complete len:656 (-),score=44.11 gb/GEZN01003120.1/:277-2244(-)
MGAVTSCVTYGCVYGIKTSLNLCKCTGECITCHPVDAFHAWIRIIAPAFDKAQSGKIESENENNAGLYQTTMQALNGGQFVDSEFPADSNHNKCSHAEARNAQWKRVTEFLKDGGVLFEGITPTDVLQGSLGDCYFLAAISVLAEGEKGPDRIKNVFLCKERNQQGCYGVKLFFRGKTREVVLDDFVPTLNNEPVFSKSVGNESWVLLLEKAWAKLHGSYGAIEGGNPASAFSALTGAPTRMVQVDDLSLSSLWKLMLGAREKGYVQAAGTGKFLSFFKSVPPQVCDCLAGAGRTWENVERNCCPETAKMVDLTVGCVKYLGCGALNLACYPCLSCCPDYQTAAALDETGLAAGHAYGILDVREIPCCCGMFSHKLIKLRNPWGKGEWKGKWSDASSSWSNALREELGGHEAEDDGMFWMSLEVFTRYFKTLTILMHRDDMINQGVDISMTSNTAYFDLNLSHSAESKEMKKADVFVTLHHKDTNEDGVLTQKGQGARLCLFDKKTGESLSSSYSLNGEDFLPFASLSTWEMSLQAGSYVVMIQLFSKPSGIRHFAVLDCYHSAGFQASFSASDIGPARPSSPDPTATSTESLPLLTDLPFCPERHDAVYGQCGAAECGRNLNTRFSRLHGKKFHQECHRCPRCSETQCLCVRIR